MLSRRLLVTSRRFSTVAVKVPKPTEKIPDVNKFLTTIGRNCSEVTEIYENNWENLFTWDTKTLKDKGVTVQQRKYILMQVNKFRNGEDIQELRLGKKSFFGGERKRATVKAKLEAEQRNKDNA